MLLVAKAGDIIWYYKRVQRDYAYVRHHANEVLRNYFVDTVPNEVLKTLVRSTAASDAASAMAARAREKDNDKLEADVLRLAKDIAKERDYRHRNRQQAFD
jgi:hypothetical protein